MSGRYLEAESVKQRINELKSGHTGQKNKDLNYQHFLELKNLEDNHNDTLMKFSEEYETIFHRLSLETDDAEQTLQNKHQLEMRELLESLDHKLPRAPKYSREYLDLKLSESNLVKQER